MVAIVQHLHAVSHPALRFVIISIVERSLGDPSPPPSGVVIEFSIFLVPQFAMFPSWDMVQTPPLDWVGFTIAASFWALRWLTAMQFLAKLMSCIACGVPETQV